jgi:cyclic beta-1,2-glucan synthetase
MKDLGWVGPYGFFESADFTPSRVKPGQRFEVVRCWLVHHQGMSLVSVANVLCNSSSQRRFHAEPLVAATERLLHEKVPRGAQIEKSLVSESSSRDVSPTEVSEKRALDALPKLNTVA